MFGDAHDIKLTLGHNQVRCVPTIKTQKSVVFFCGLTFKFYFPFGIASWFNFAAGLFCRETERGVHSTVYIRCKVDLSANPCGVEWGHRGEEKARTLPFRSPHS